MFAQLALLVAGALLASFMAGLNHGLAAAFGASLAMMNTFLSKRSIRRASELAYTKPDASMLPVYSGFVQRLVLFACGFFIGVSILALLPLPLLLGFILSQFGYLACSMK
ncbi:MAG: ATP synthase subunit I [Arenicellales bacterium]